MGIRLFIIWNSDGGDAKVGFTVFGAFSQITRFGRRNNSLDLCLCTLESMVPEPGDYLSGGPL